jgi:bifunctional UDP-N-acetylglucosamine pyrophosphorylase/glucosamine-1-phosphate N-acetyltransferase
MSGLSVIILAAGHGKRMSSVLPKVLHPLAGRPLLVHVVHTAQRLAARDICVVYGHGGELLRERLADLPVRWALQERQLGTGHAVAQAMSGVGDEDVVLILYGDVPLVAADTLRRLGALAGPDAIALLTAEMADPAGYGRLLRGEGGAVRGIVEEKDAGVADLRIREVNTGMMAVPARRLRRWLGDLDNNNAQGEYYLTDVVAAAVAEGASVYTVHPDSVVEVMGVNTRVQLAGLERGYQRVQAERLMLAGATLADPERLDVRGEVSVGRDVYIDANVVLEGRVVIGDGVRIGPNNYLRDVEVAHGAQILPNCVIEESAIGPGSRVGPFSHLRPEVHLAEGVHVGNFVELKKSQVGEGSKVNHLSYVGDTEVGSRVNIGAGTITCNYDGANKHKTIIGDEAFIGSDTQLVAPVRVGDGATIGAGSTITRDAPPGELTLSRSPQTTYPGWKRPRKKPK